MATMEELADKVAHATTGKEVRGAIAEGFGQFDQVKGEVFRRVKAVEDDNATLNQRVDKLDDDLSAEAQARKAGDDNEARDRRTADEKLKQELRSEMAAGDKNLQSQIDDKASIEDLNDAKAEWLTRAKHIALGTDLETVEAAVVMVLQKRGMI